MVYTGKQNPTAGLGHVQTVVINLADDFFGKSDANKWHLR